MIKILYAGRQDQWDDYGPSLRKSLDALGLDYELLQSTQSPADIDYIVYAPNGGLTDFTPFTGVKLVQNLWAGVEVPVANETLIQPLARMVEPGLTWGMVDYVMGHVLRHHLGTDAFANAKPGEWLEDLVPPLAGDRTVGVLGLGELGMVCAQKLAEFGFNTIGWSRSQKTDNKVTCYSGADGLVDVLRAGEILVLLLPNTPDTADLINAKTIAQMREGVVIINPGRGTLINDRDLLDGLNSGKISGATLDVFHTEPLPETHEFWAHPKVLVTPHIASATRTKTACEVVAQNIQRGEAGLSFLHLVDKAAGY